jgi:hypothetical protein
MPRKGIPSPIQGVPFLSPGSIRTDKIERSKPAKRTPDELILLPGISVVLVRRDGTVKSKSIAEVETPPYEEAG